MTWCDLLAPWQMIWREVVILGRRQMAPVCWTATREGDKDSFLCTDVEEGT